MWFSLYWFSKSTTLSLRTDSEVGSHPWSMEAPCNNLAVYQAGRWQQLVAIQHRTLPILLPPPRRARTALLLSVLSRSRSVLPLWRPSLSSVSSCPPFLSLSLSLSFRSPFHLLPVPRVESTLIYARSPAHPFQEWPTCASLSGCLARFMKQSGT